MCFRHRPKVALTHEQASLALPTEFFQLGLVRTPSNWAWFGPFVQTVQSATSPDPRSYDPQLHDYIVFDNVNDMRFVLDYRALFQANSDIHILGESRTGMYSYDVWLFRVPLVVTVDLSAKWIPQDAWIKENCHDVLLQGPCWDAELS